jgi:hypothetical protein
VDTVLLRRIYALIVIEHGTCRVYLAGISASSRPSVKFLIRDRDGQFTACFDAVFAEEGIRILASPPQAAGHRDDRVFSPTRSSNRALQGQGLWVLPEAGWQAPPCRAPTAPDSQHRAVHAPTHTADDQPCSTAKNPFTWVAIVATLHPGDRHSSRSEARVAPKFY